MGILVRFQIHEGVCGLCSSKDQSQVAINHKAKVYSVIQPCITTAYVYIRVYLDLRSLQVGLPVGEVCSLRLFFFLNLRGNTLKSFWSRLILHTLSECVDPLIGIMVYNLPPQSATLN